MNVDEHLAPFEHDGRLCVGGVELDRLAEQVGSTPFFAYDRGLVTERIATVRAALQDGRTDAASEIALR